MHCINYAYKKHFDGNYIFVENVLPLQIPGPCIKWWLYLCDHKMFFRSWHVGFVLNS
jgi:hypothetical protein